jgi:hypothetical protein
LLIANSSLGRDGIYHGYNDRFHSDNDRFNEDNDRFHGDNDRFNEDNDRFHGDNDRFNGDNDRYSGALGLVSQGAGKLETSRNRRENTITRAKGGSCWRLKEFWRTMRAKAAKALQGDSETSFIANGPTGGGLKAPQLILI